MGVIKMKEKGMGIELKDAARALTNRVREAEKEVKDVLDKLAIDTGVGVKSCYVETASWTDIEGRRGYDVINVHIELGI